MLFVMLMTYQRSFLIESEVKYITSSVIGDDMMIPSGGRVTMIETYSYYQISSDMITHDLKHDCSIAGIRPNRLLEMLEPSRFIIRY